MILTLFFQLAAATPDTSRLLPVRDPVSVVAAAEQDTTRRRARAIEVSDWYNRRLVIHRVGAYAMLPVFTAQYIAGSKLFDQGNGGAAAPSWARPLHKAGAKTIAGIFTVNTVTGLWNLWDSRQVEEHRWLRYSHALTMLAADASFAYTGLKLADDAKFTLANRRKHRQMALISIGVSTASGVLMKLKNR
jgi:hypothetical protein